MILMWEVIIWFASGVFFSFFSPPPRTSVKTKLDSGDCEEAFIVEDFQYDESQASCG
jgi:hypothetical protein